LWDASKDRIIISGIGTNNQVFAQGIIPLQPANLNYESQAP
jgi:hypothetical protein